MNRPVRVVTDSNTMIPPALAAELSITVVPLTVTIGGDELVEDAAAGRHRRLPAAPCRRGGHHERAVARDVRRGVPRLGPGPIVSVHIGGSLLGDRRRRQRLAVTLGDADVTVVDTGTASFLAGCCVLSAAEAARDGADPAGVVAAAERTAVDRRQLLHARRARTRPSRRAARRR